MRVKGTSSAEQRDQMKATLADANKVESEANKALTGEMEAADAYHKVFFVKVVCNDPFHVFRDSGNVLI